MNGKNSLIHGVVIWVVVAVGLLTALHMLDRAGPYPQSADSATSASKADVEQTISAQDGGTMVQLLKQQCGEFENQETATAEEYTAVAGDELYGEYEFTFVTVGDNNRIWAQMSTRGAIFLPNTQGYAIVQCMLEAVGSDLSPSHFATETILQADYRTYRSTYCSDRVGDATGEAYMNAVKRCYAEQWGETSAVKLSDTAMVVFASKNQTQNTISAFIDPLDSSQLVSSNDDMANLYTGSGSNSLSSTVQATESDSEDDPLGFRTVPARGRWCRSDGKCLTIFPETEGQPTPMILDLTEMGDENPLPSGKTRVKLNYPTQQALDISHIRAYSEYGAVQMITQHSVYADCSLSGLHLGGSCDNGIYTPDMDGLGVGTLGVGDFEFVEEPILVTMVKPFNFSEGTSYLDMDGIDASNPPSPYGTWLYISSYGEVPAPNSISADTVFHTHI